ncbi:hypothetical protein NHQ30_007462 [Ciborinia camelliae]|nr:hypothetical protein NHQ30_007462 [Ciborinia camelliae]
MASSTLLGLFLEICCKYPNNVAVEDDPECLTYHHLDIRSSSLANQLSQAGVTAGQAVPLWPLARIENVLGRLHPKVIVYTGDIFKFDGVTTISAEDLHVESDGSFCVPAYQNNLVGESLACIIFTSGTTGEPKGVMIEHSSIVHFVSSPPFNYCVTAEDRVLLVLSIAFDGGETPSRNLLEAWKPLGRPVWVAYGPTEATCSTLTGLIPILNEVAEFDPTLLGEPIDGAIISIVDEDLREIHNINQEGGLLISGPGLERGYWNDKSRTAEKFITLNGHRTYRTGGYCKFKSISGNQRTISFCGRKDRTVKIRGFLVNLDVDVDNHILSVEPELEAAHSCLVNGLLYTAIKPSNIELATLKLRLQASMPPYMVPDHIYSLKSFPMTPNGKVDADKIYQIMAQPEDQKQQDEDQPTSSSFHSVLLRGLSEFVGISRSDVEGGRSFVSHGLHSLTAARLSAHCRKHGYIVSAQNILTASSIDDFCQSLNYNSRPVMIPPGKSYLISDNEPAVIPLTEFQLTLVYGSLKVTHFNVVSYTIKCHFHEIGQLRDAWSMIAEIEPVFRTVIEVQDGIYVQRLAMGMKTPWYEAIIESDQVEKELLKAATAAGLGTCFTILRIRNSSEVLHVWSIHHALIDGFSASLILNKVENISQGQEVPGGPHYSTHAALFVSLRIPLAIYSASINVTPAAVYYAAWALLVSIYTNSDIVLFGAVISGRNFKFEWADSMIGPLLNTLPCKTIPRYIATMKNLPINNNGKIDARKLAQMPRKDIQRSCENISGLTKFETLIAEEWRSLISLDPDLQICGSGSFFDLGGHSILHLRLAARLRERFSVHITVKDIIRAPILTELASTIGGHCLSSQKLKESELSDGEQLKLELLSAPEMDWWYRYTHSEQQTAFNVPYIARLPPQVDLEKLVRSIKTALERHAVLRSNFMTHRDGSVKRVLSERPIKACMAERIDLLEFVNCPFNLAKDVLVRIKITPSLLAMSISHILLDLTGLSRLLFENSEIYNDRALDQYYKQYFNVTQWNEPPSESDILFWSSYFNGINLKRCPDRRKRSHKGISSVCQVPHELYGAFLEITTQESISLHQFALTATAIVLHAICERRDIVLGSPYVNRSSTADQNVVGLFLEALPVRLHYNITNTTCKLNISETLSQTRSSSQSALAHAIPWVQLLSHFKLPFPSDHQQLFDCVVTFHDERQSTNTL